MVDPVSILVVTSGVAVAGAAVAGIVALASRHMKKIRGVWQDAAAEHGLQFHRGGFFKGMSMTGSSRGVGMEVQTVTRSAGNHSQIFTVVKARVPAALPAGLKLTRSGFGGKLATALGAQDIPVSDPVLDKHLRVKGEDPVAVRALLDHAHGASGAGVLMKGNAQSHLKDDTLVVELQGYAQKDLSTVIGAAASAANALAVAARAPWATLSQQHGLSHTESGLTARLDGDIGGVPVQVRADGALKDAVTTIVVDLGPTMPEQARITAGKGGPTLGDPILDGRVRIGGPEAEAAAAAIRARLDSPDADLRGCLMDALHGLPNAAIEDGVLRVQVRGRISTALPDLVQRAVALGAAFRGPPKQPERHRQAAHRRQRS